MVKAILVALIAGFCKIDQRLFGMAMLHRPLIVSTLVGIVYGDITGGLIFGAQMELLSMGLAGIGAHSGMPDITIGAALSTAFALGSGTGHDLALTLSLPISSFALTIGYLSWIPLNHLLSEKARTAAGKGDTRTMEICQLTGLFNYFFFPFLVVLVGMVAGAPIFDKLIDVIPAWISGGITLATGLLPALGFALLLQLIFSWKMSPYLFIGFVAVAFFGLSNIGVAVIGGILAILAFNADDGKKEVLVNDNEI